MWQHCHYVNMSHYALIFLKYYNSTLQEPNLLKMLCYSTATTLYSVFKMLPCNTAHIVRKNVGREKCQLLLLLSVGRHVSMAAGPDWISKC